MSNRNELRSITRGAYDIQKLRIQTGLRLCANLRSKLSENPSEQDEETDKAITLIKADYRRLSDAIANTKKKDVKSIFKGEKIISTHTEYVLVDHYIALEQRERELFKSLENVLKEFPIWTEFLHKTQGIGPAMAAVIISEIDISKAKYPSSLWMYAGLDVAPDGAGRSLRAAHLIDRAYTNSKGEEATRKSITYNPFLKTKLMGVLATSFLRSKSIYADVYNDYKHRLESDPRKVEWTKLHRHNASLRYMIKIFLIDLYSIWRKLEGLPQSPTYQEAKLGHVHTDTKK